MNRGLRCFAPALRALIVLMGLALGLLGTLPVGFAAGLATHDERPTPGQHIYDTTGLLTADEIATLEQHASDVEAAGAPCVVYLQAKDATEDETRQDAGDLMNRWDIESKAGAQDGFVMFFNLTPGDLRHGEVVLFAGKKWFDSSLPENETQRIYDDVMVSTLKDGDTATAIADGLDAVVHDLRYGPPKPSAIQQGFQAFGRLPYNVIAGLYLLALLVFGQRAVRGEPKHVAATPLATPPGDLAPAVVGALLQGRVTDAQMEGTLLDFARQGLLSIESASSKQDVQLQLKKNNPTDIATLPAYATTVWSGIVDATNIDGIVTNTRMPKIRTGWGRAKTELHADLVARGWLEAHGESRRTPLYGLGAFGIVLSVIGFAVALIAGEGWAVIGALALFLGAIVELAFASNVSELTEAGEAALGPWRGYASVLQTGYPQLSHEELDVALPYAVAMGYRNEIGRALKVTDASGNTYSPAWFVAPQSQRWGTSFYPYWIGWHSAMYPPSSSSGSGGGFSGGGAAGGGGGGGGGF